MFLSLFVGVFQILKYSFGSYDFFGRAVFSKDRFSDKFLLFFNYPYPRLTTWYYGFGEFGGLINSGIFLSFILIRNWFFKLFSVLVLFYALYLTGARASYLAFFLSFIFFINRFSYKLFSSFIIFISISILPLFFLSALDDFHFLGGGTVAERLSGYVVAAKQILSSPIGHGPNHWEHIMAIKVYGEGEEVALHNSMLWFGYVAGLPVLLLFLSHLWYFILSWRGWSESTFSRGLFCTFSSAFLSILFSPFFTNYLMFILIGVLFWYVRNREKYSFC
ncbi:O-antigen ligase family protein [Litoribrevibacter albus]|uniref:O-antigen ligase-related domain-containing protein n=1 Tax=Litoribrevibacter albus TaxID=1473156 RepID=A0AA37WA57_9GAMM|nr:O-antigen ligase family protein [Litoribrevibacter albus]GLQ33206.1 hypothetical protein GCM10007876_36860 [Litoribrevibacter albus]